MQKSEIIPRKTTKSVQKKFSAGSSAQIRAARGPENPGFWDPENGPNLGPKRGLERPNGLCSPCFGPKFGRFSGLFAKTGFFGTFWLIFVIFVNFSEFS